ncbi:hypothetical protein Z517_04871 [Fonsecaea pedrosoi CBS 271.37]|uniref:Carboxymuconolactone decarboxylase-like domain-containing protein n=1 Tax=Fonsecaea pedrosoi CBS 271.37 TaxID=1442368 RepID=A0A0D2GTF7_9EURO|nr:uncharacterized protein Z517_04871 [Fonsecaea pedrosoi CBS 271.37]KIW81845.1 hypothetical protein Z517_04871 [Fonsecaea pedrosoi CBS 271.37]
MSDINEQQTPSGDKLALGRQMVRKFAGDKHVDAVAATMKKDHFSKVSEEFISEVCWSGYARPGLDFKERALMNIAMLTALGRAPELRIHIRCAVYNGFTEEKVAEACRHAMVYCGVPAGRDALIIASEVFDELRKAGDYL